jgi:hypothetical protein
MIVEGFKTSPCCAADGSGGGALNFLVCIDCGILPFGGSVMLPCGDRVSPCGVSRGGEMLRRGDGEMLPSAGSGMLPLG